MSKEVVHGFEHESLEAKVAWFATLTIAERLHHLEAMYELVVALNPKLRQGWDDEPPSASVRILELPSR